jgi:hypothetical protein
MEKRSVAESVEGVVWSSSRDDRSLLSRCGMCGARPGELCAANFFHTGRRFEVALCWPGRSLTGADDVVIEGRCQATVEDTYCWDFDMPGRHGDVATCQSIVYRGACVGCGWAAAASHPSDEGAAIADALDHALVGWRSVPIVARHHHDANDKAVAKWTRQITALYDGYGLEKFLSPEHGGVIRTTRVGGGSRSHWSRGFYDMCGEVVAEDPDRRGRPLSQRSEEQLGLF